MKTAFLILMMFLTSCGTPMMYLTSNAVKVTGISEVDGKKIVEVCGINNKHEKVYSYFQTTDEYAVGDHLAIAPVPGK